MSDYAIGKPVLFMVDEVETIETKIIDKRPVERGIEYRLKGIDGWVQKKFIEPIRRNGKRK